MKKKRLDEIEERKIKEKGVKINQTNTKTIDEDTREMTNTNVTENEKIEKPFNESIKGYDSIPTQTTKDDTKSIIIKEEKNELEDLEELQIITFKHIIGRHEDSVDFIKELSNGYFVSGGGLDKKLIIYNENLRIILIVQNFKDRIYSICERKYFNEARERKKNQEYELICCSNKDLNKLTIRQNKPTLTPYEIKDTTCVNCVEIKEHNYVIVGQGWGIYFVDLFKNGGELKQHKFKEGNIRGAIKINDNIVALTSSSTIPGGKDELFFYNTKNKKANNFIEGYSFASTVNNMAILKSSNKNIQDKILLVACIKYKSGQKNGILLVNPQTGDNKLVEKPFYETDDFQVYCFCQLRACKNLDNLHIQYEDTDFFFVGGFDEGKGMGAIKLYKAIFNEKAYKTKIEYIQDVDIIPNNLQKNDGKEMSYDINLTKSDMNNLSNINDHSTKSTILDSTYKRKFEDLDGPISCIIQSTTGKILLTCYNKNVYEFSDVNLDFYL